MVFEDIMTHFLHGGWAILEDSHIVATTTITVLLYGRGLLHHLLSQSRRHLLLLFHHVSLMLEDSVQSVLVLVI